MMQTTYFLIAVCFVCLINCTSETKQKTIDRSGNKEQSNIDIKFFYEMPQDEFEKFKVSVGKIKTGDDHDTVIKMLGQPTFDRIVRGKEKSAHFICRDVTYYIKKRQEGLVSEKYDRYVAFIFNERDKLVKIISQCEGIKSQP